MSDPDISNLAATMSANNNSSNGSSEPEIKSILKKEAPVKHVQFGEVKEIQDEAENSAQDRSALRSQSKIKGGKANPIRDLFLLLSILGILFFMTRDGENKKREYAEDEPLEEGKEIPLAKSMNNVAKELMEGLFDTNSFIRRTARKDPCAVYVNVGTVPDTGYSLFAGRSLKEGEVLSIPSTTISLDSKSSVASVAFLLKPHPTKANVRANLTFSGAKDRPDGRIELVATKPIEEGHELYSALADHPLMTSAGLPSYFQTMPTPEEYELEESIRKDVLLTTKRISVPHRKKGIHVFPEKQLMALTRRTLAKIDTRLERVMRTSEEHSLGFHQRASTCVDDIKVESSRLKATKDFEKKEVIAYLSSVAASKQ